MKIAFVEDRKEDMNRLLTIAKNALPHANFFTFYSGKEFLETWKKGEYDVIFLDIFIGDSIGIDLAREIRSGDTDVRLIFCTTSNEFACESYEVGANYYLHKPVSSESFDRMIRMLRLSEYELKKYIHLPDGQRVILRNIIYSEYHNHLITIHVKLHDPVVTRLSQTEWEQLLSDYSYFYSCSKGCLVNFHQIQQQDGSMFLMSNGDRVPISRRKTKEALAAYANFRFEQMRKETI